jgi:hypothetical protein
MTCDLARKPFVAVGSTVTRKSGASLHSEVICQTTTDSIHPNAASSWARSKPATSLATRRRIAFDRASGTTRRNSRKPRACRRSRIALTAVRDLP